MNNVRHTSISLCYVKKYGRLKLCNDTKWGKEVIDVLAPPNFGIPERWAC
jgi:hypothetical protein